MHKPRQVIVKDSANFVTFEVLRHNGCVFSSIEVPTWGSDTEFRPTVAQIAAAFQVLFPNDAIVFRWRASAMGDYPHSAAVRTEIEAWQGVQVEEIK